MRFTPFQFSISVSFVVLLLAGAAIAGYLYGLKKAAERAEQVSLDIHDAPPISEPDHARSETPAPVTFYTVLTESRQDVTAPSSPQETARVQPKETPEPGQATGDLSLVLQVASYRNRETAANLLKNLSSEGYSGTIQFVDLGERGTWYRVHVGPYGSEPEAKRILDKLRTERDLKGYIVR